MRQLEIKKNENGLQQILIVKICSRRVCERKFEKIKGIKRSIEVS